MKKLSLRLDALTVESFEPARIQQGRGTVQAHLSSADRYQCDAACMSGQYCLSASGCMSHEQTCFCDSAINCA
ncbi:hypothetical protein [Longimicrobium sp.]|uniref:hypothetical protein n=1 Tax=Longimicrobium sp. TaxID=2029185 RepID=UPI002E366698|nr:hypothetical protein [Longimicrobium sp.]HEX6039480.1 hypothetical protein [Longimicrobium sp.]